MKVVCKKTTELTQLELAGINELFLEVMHQERDNESLLQLHLNTPLGYSYHSLLYNDKEELVGNLSYIPFYYLDGDRKFMAAFGIDSMVLKPYRDFFGYADMANVIHEELKKEGCELKIGFPNDVAYPITKKGMKFKDVDSLTTYCMIRNVGGFKPSLKILNPLTRIAAKLQYCVSFFSRGEKEYSFRFKKDRDSFDNVRYNWFGGQYDFVDLASKGKAVYKIMNFKGAEAAFLIDVYPLNRSNFEKSVEYIYKNERKKIDIIIYVGHLPFTPVGLITIPHKFEPKHFYFTCKKMRKDSFDDGLYDIKNWEVNLSNYDLI